MKLKVFAIFCFFCLNLINARQIKRSITTQTNSDMSIHNNINLLPSTMCGNIVNDRIANGNKTEPLEYPWMAIIQYRTGNGIQQLCGGSLINNRYVLTAAHCVAFLRAGMTVDSVVLGEHNTKTPIDCHSDGYCAPPPQTITVEQVISHPSYNRRSFSNDIGLLRLSRNVELSESINAVCLPTTTELQNANLTMFRVTGWGKTENKTISDVLLKADLQIVPFNDCQRSYESSLAITTNQICAGGGGVDSCQGDSGGPAIFPETYESYGTRFIQYGIVSGGQNSCGANVDIPGLYTKVAAYMAWILDTIRN